MILTKKETLKTNIGIWAVPIREPDEGEFPFSYELYGIGSHPSHWRDAAIFLGTAPLAIDVPEGVDLYAKCLETLDLQAQEALAVYTRRMEEIELSRKSLMLISHEKVTLVDGVELCDE